MGKSTLARRYVADRPLALCLDIDDIRRNLGRWDEQPEESGLAARDLAYTMAARHLAQGHDVVVPQLAVRPDFFERLAEVAAQAGATFHEVLVDAEIEVLAERFSARADVPELAQHHADAVRQLGGRESLRSVHRDLMAFVANRPDTIVIETHSGDVEAAYDQLVEVLGPRSR